MGDLGCGAILSGGFEPGSAGGGVDGAGRLGRGFGLGGHGEVGIQIVDEIKERDLGGPWIWQSSERAHFYSRQIRLGNEHQQCV